MRLERLKKREARMPVNMTKPAALATILNGMSS